MAMKKADMEYHFDRYEEVMHAARTYERSGLYQQAVSRALESWEHVDGMMQYVRKYRNLEFVTISAIELVLRYAPLLFDFGCLDQLEELLSGTKRIERNTDDRMADKLTEARDRMRRAHRMWHHIEMNPGTRQDRLRRDLGGSQDEWRANAEAWEKMGLLQRTPEGGSYRLDFSTRMGRIIPGKCPACGTVQEAPKSMLLEEQSCPECNSTIRFVLLGS